MAHASNSWRSNRFSLSFRLQCALRVVCLGATMFVLIYLALTTALYASMTILGLLVVMQTWGLVGYVERTNRELVRFLEAVKYGDASQSWSSTKFRSTSFRELADSFASVVGEFQKIRVEKEEQYQAVQRVLQHVGAGLLAFDSEGRVDFINPAAQRLLDVGAVGSLDGIPHKPLVHTLRTMQAGGRALVELVSNDELLQLVLVATKFRSHTIHKGNSEQQHEAATREMTLVSLHNIIGELEEKEVEAWQTLIRVLTHEIMNSIAPISSLAGTIGNAVEVAPEGVLDEETRSDVQLAASTIRRRSEGLLGFVEKYRNLTRIPKPAFALVPVQRVFRSVEKVMQPRLQSASKSDMVRLSVEISPASLEVIADEGLLEQLLINLLINACHAVEGVPNPAITLAAWQNERGRVVMEVRDNGIGIAPEALDKIFIPFFTTKPDGSGIGLSLARQVMVLHGGSITARSVAGEGTVFRLRF
jgi:signal transduction histidine kinase